MSSTRLFGRCFREMVGAPSEPRRSSGECLESHSADLFLSIGTAWQDGGQHHLRESRFVAAMSSMQCTPSICVVADLASWFRLLPNVKWLDIDLSELTYWLDDESVGRDLHVFLERLEKFCVTCFLLDEATLEKVLAYFVDSGHFSRVRRLCFVGCPRLSFSSSDIHRWLEMICGRSSDHQLEFLKIDFFDEEHLVPGLELGHTLNMIKQGGWIAQVHQYVRPGYFCLSLERMIG